ncbi:MAG: hypothetical protein WBI07_15310 [Mobilitalea sp.]
MRKKLHGIIKVLLISFVFSLIALALGLVASILIANYFNYRLQDVIFCLGILLLIIGTLLSMKGNPSGSSINSIGNKNTNAISYFDLEVTRQERERNPYHKDFM